MSKIVKKHKGTVSHFDDDSFEFHPYGKGEPVFDHTHKVGGGTLGFDKLVIDTKECKATITVCKDASKNRLKVLWR